MKRAGVATGIGLSVIALITGLSLGPKRAGKHLESQAKEEAWTPIRPGDKPETAWTPLTPAEVTGGTLVWIGDHIYLVAGGVALCVWRRKRKR